MAFLFRRGSHPQDSSWIYKYSKIGAEEDPKSETLLVLSIGNKGHSACLSVFVLYWGLLGCDISVPDGAIWWGHVGWHQPALTVAWIVPLPGASCTLGHWDLPQLEGGRVLLPCRFCRWRLILSPMGPCLFFTLVHALAKGGSTFYKNIVNS